MKKFKINIDGGLVVPMELASKLSLHPYIYDKKGVGDITSFKFTVDKLGDYIKFPRNRYKFDLYYKDYYNYEYVDNRVVGDDISFELTDGFALREYQIEPVENIIRNLHDNRDNAVILQAEPSFGKTFILPKVIQNMGRRTLVLVDRDLLRDQMFEEFTNNSSAKVVKLNKGVTSVDDLGDVNITTFQLLLKNGALVKLLSKHIGMVVVDECHVAPAEKFLEVLADLPAKFRLGLSATPTRSDGLTSIITDTFGEAKVLGSNPNNLKVTNVVVNTRIPVSFSNKSQYAKQFIKAMTTPLAKCKRTPINLAIMLATELINKGRRVLLYVTYGELQTLLKRGLEALGFTAEIIQGKTPKAVRAQIIQHFQEGKIDFLISGVILQKGVSIHRLDSIINLAPQNKENLEQVKGRLRREYKGKPTPLFIYFTFAGKLEYGTAVVVDALKYSTTKGDKFHQVTVDGVFRQVRGETK